MKKVILFTLCSFLLMTCEKPYYTVSTKSSPSYGGETYGGGTFESGTSITIGAVARLDHEFVRWNDNVTTAIRTVKVTNDVTYTAYFKKKQNTEGGQAVDLGLPSGTAWADRNVGASSPEKYGEYYGWGETYPQNYSHYNNLPNNIAGTSYDVARKNWGSTWHIPTVDQIFELLENCIWNWGSKNGVKGCYVIGPNGNSIFMPAAGYIQGATPINVGNKGFYLSSNCRTMAQEEIWGIEFREGHHNGTLLYFAEFYTIRPVKD